MQNMFILVHNYIVAHHFSYDENYKYLLYILVILVFDSSHCELWCQEIKLGVLSLLYLFSYYYRISV